MVGQHCHLQTSLLTDELHRYCLPIFSSGGLSGIKPRVLYMKYVKKNNKANDLSLTFLNCMTRFMRLLVVFCAC